MRDGPACDLYLAPGEVGRGSAALSPRIFILLLCSTIAKKLQKIRIIREHDDDSIVPLILSAYEIIDKVRHH